MSDFSGIPVAALDFYDDLELDNTKTFWAENKHRYDEHVAAPMKAIAAAVAEEFGQPKIFRPYRDVRFSHDKTPYKTHQGLFVATAPATGYYLQVGAAGVLVGAGFYQATPDRLASIREAIDHDRHGPELEKLLATMVDEGWDLGGDTLKTAPRGWPTDHPRIELLRHRSIVVRRDYGFEGVTDDPGLIDRIRADWRRAAPLLDWVHRFSRA